MLCPACNRDNPSDCNFCVHCSRSLAYTSAEAPRAADAPFPTMRGARIASQGDRKFALGKNSFTATMLSFVPPLGQIYNEDYKKATFFGLAFYISLFVPVFGWLVSLVLYVVNIFNTYQVAKREKALW